MAKRIRIEVECRDTETVDWLKRELYEQMQQYSEGSYIITQFETIDMPDYDLVDGMLEWRDDRDGSTSRTD